jgi:uncharacterized protein (TIGR00251 family)
MTTRAAADQERGQENAEEAGFGFRVSGFGKGAAAIPDSRQARCFSPNRSPHILPSIMVTVTVKVVPGASRNRVVGRYGDAIKVQVAAAPERGKANDAVIRLLAETLGIKPSQIELLSGQTQPRKTFQITGLEQAQVDARLTVS